MHRASSNQHLAFGIWHHVWRLAFGIWHLTPGARYFLGEFVFASHFSILRPETCNRERSGWAGWTAHRSNEHNAGFLLGHFKIRKQKTAGGEL
jgi:hypothetical protein